MDAEAARLERRHRGVLRHTYHSALRGMALTMSDADAAVMRSEPTVAFVEQDRILTAMGVQTNAPANLDRLDQRSLPLSGAYSYAGDGSGVTIYIIDSGINFTHTDFGGRAVTGVDVATTSTSGDDCYGHGTHVSGIAGGTTYGVAKKARLVAVRVLDCTGYTTSSQLIAGIDWVTQHHVTPSVANMSLGGYAVSSAINQAVDNSVASGVTYVVAAGNTADDACNYSPSSASRAITVASTNSSDAFVSSSSFGPCVELLAPGNAITSDFIGSNTAIATRGGTSMASPHVAGLAAIYLQSHPSASPSQVQSALVAAATSGAITGVPANTPNKLAYGAPATSSNQAPVAQFSVTCPTRQCSFDARSSTDDVGIVSYAWNWGDGRSETRTSATALNTFAVNGTYTVTLTVTDGGGLKSSVSRAVQVPTSAQNQSPTATIASPAASSSVVQGQSVTFTGSATDPESGSLTGTSLQWTSSRDGVIGSGATFSRNNLSVGTHTITLTARDPQGASSVRTVTLVVTATPPANQSPTATISSPTSGSGVLQGQGVTFTGSASDPESGTLSGTSLQWRSSIDGAIGSGTTFSKSNLSIGTHTITLTATDPQGAASSRSITLTVTGPAANQAPVAKFTVNCVGQAYPHQCALDASTSTDDVKISSYIWTWGTGQTETKLSPLAKNTWPAAGTYTITLTVTDGSGLTNSRAISVNVP
ncbi:MAG: PKD domain-containing protein [Gemmatimonadaceae bacterium]